MINGALQTNRRRLYQSGEIKFSVTMVTKVTNVSIVIFATMVTKVTNILLVVLVTRMHLKCLVLLKFPAINNYSSSSSTACNVLRDILNDSGKWLSSLRSPCGEIVGCAKNMISVSE